LAGSKGGAPATVQYDVVASSSAGSATAEASGIVAAIASDLVVSGTRQAGVHPPEAVFDDQDVVARVRERGVTVTLEERID
jgi:hypothetical protein